MDTIILKTKIIAIRDIEIALLKQKEDGQLIPEIVFETIKEVENGYWKDAEDDEEECLKCGELCGKRMVGDESAYYCPNCN